MSLSTLFAFSVVLFAMILYFWYKVYQMLVGMCEKMANEKKAYFRKLRLHRLLKIKVEFFD